MAEEPRKIEDLTFEERMAQFLKKEMPKLKEELEQLRVQERERHRKSILTWEDLNTPLCACA